MNILVQLPPIRLGNEEAKVNNMTEILLKAIARFLMTKLTLPKLNMQDSTVGC